MILMYKNTQQIRHGLVLLDLFNVGCCNFGFWGGIYWNESNTKPVIKYVTIKQPLASANTSVADTMANNDSVKSADNKLKQNLQDSINVNKNTIEKYEREGNVPTKPSSAAVERADLKMQLLQSEPALIVLWAQTEWLQ